MPQNTLTLIGTLASEVVTAIDDAGHVARFRLLLQSRRMDRSTNSWVTSDRTFLWVACRRHLATGVAASLQSGDPVVVCGALRTRRTSRRSSRIELEAFTVGPDLSRTTLAPRRSVAEGAA